MFCAAMEIRETEQADLAAMSRIHRAAFGGDDEAVLVRALLADPSAGPILSLLAEDGAEAIGHVLFSAVALVGANQGATAAILAPLAVIPGRHGKGTGSALVSAGLQRLTERGTGLVFVFGDPAYYARFGFVAAEALGLAAPYPIAAEYVEAWRVRELADGLIGTVRGQLRCADTLSKPELWNVGER